MAASTVDQEVLREQLIAIRNGLQVKFTEGLEDMSEGTLIARLAETVRSTGRNEDYEWLTDFAFVKEWDDERSYNDFKAYQYQIPNRDWEITLAVKRNDLLDGRAGMYARRIDRLVQNFDLHKRHLAADLLNNGETGLCYDGTPFFGTAHPIYKLNTDTREFVETATQSNLVNGTLTADRAGADLLADAITQMRKARTDNGRRARVNPDTLVVPLEMEWIARELMTADKLSDGASNLVPNPVKGRFTVEVEAELTDANDVYLFDSSNPIVKPLIYQIRQEPQFDGFDARQGNLHLFMHKEYLFGADARYNMGYGLYHGSLKIKGA